MLLNFTTVSAQQDVLITVDPYCLNMLILVRKEKQSTREVLSGK